MSSYSTQAADEVIRVAVRGAGLALRLAGRGAERMSRLLFSALSEKNRSRGRTRLINLLRSGRELKVLTVKDTDLTLFLRAAKRYGVLFTALKDRQLDDGVTDILIKAEDMLRVKRMTERYGIGEAEHSEITEKQSEGKKALAAQEKRDEYLIDVMGKGKTERPFSDRTEQRDPSGLFSEKRSITEEDVSEGRPSVLRELKRLSERIRGSETGRQIIEHEKEK